MQKYMHICFAIKRYQRSQMPKKLYYHKPNILIVQKSNESFKYVFN